MWYFWEHVHIRVLFPHNKDCGRMNTRRVLAAGRIMHERWPKNMAVITCTIHVVWRDFVRFLFSVIRFMSVLCSCFPPLHVKSYHGPKVLSAWTCGDRTCLQSCTRTKSGWFKVFASKKNPRTLKDIQSMRRRCQDFSYWFLLNLFFVELA